MATSRTTRPGRPALLVRFPRVRAPRGSGAPIPVERAPDYPTLADDIATLDRVVGPVFVKANQEALHEQNRYRRQQVLILVGSALMTGLGGLQAAFPQHQWPGVGLAVLGVVVGVLGNAVKELDALDRFMTARVKAERLRSTYFRYLSRTGRYAPDDRASVLRHAVLSIGAGEEPT